jgi:hypothetical protein
MPTPSAYPTPALGGPRYLRCQIISKQYPVILGPKYTDGGQDSFLASTTPSEIVWEIEYDGILASEAVTLDAHNDSAYDTHLQFNFTDPETGTTHAVKYLEYQRGARTHRDINKRLVKLIKRP